MSSKMSSYKAYNQAFQTVGKTRQIVMLYDGVIRYIRQAQEAIKANQIEERFRLLTKASEVVLGLQSCLDFEKGGDMANLLYDFYSSADAQILSIQRSNSLETCEEIITELKEMRDAWKSIDDSEDVTVTVMPAAMTMGKNDAGSIGISA